MGVFGIQLVVTMIVASVLHKLSPYYSFGRWLATAGLRRFLPPSDDALRPHVAAAASTNRSKKKLANSRGISKEYTHLDDSLAIPKSANIKLESAPIRTLDLILIRYSEEFQLMMDLACAAVAVFAITSLYYYAYPSAVVSEYNLSSVWMIILLGYTIKVLGSLTRVYFSEELSHERSIGIVFTMMFFVCALGVLIIDEGILEFRLEKSYKDINKCFAKLLETYIRDPKEFRLLPMWAFEIGLAVLGSLLGATFIFPGFRFAEMHFDALRTTRNLFVKMLFHLSYISPVIALVLWIRPVSKDVIAKTDTVHFLGEEVSYESFRFGTLIFVCLLKLLLYQVYLQNYLNMGRFRVENLKREQGRITISNLRKKVSNIFSFYSGVAVQYMAPVLILLSLSILLYTSLDHPLSSYKPTEDEDNSNIIKFSGFGISMFHGCISFFCWWVCFTEFISTGLGSVISAYF